MSYPLLNEMQPRLRFDDHLSKLPSFRTTEDKLPENCLVSDLGLEKLKASASGQITHTNLEVLKSLENRAKRINVLDLRREAHGYIFGKVINISNDFHPYAIAWKRKSPQEGKTGYVYDIANNFSSEVEDFEIKLGEGLLDNPQIYDTDKGLFNVEATKFFTERQLFSELGDKYIYVRLPASDDMPVEDREIQSFVEMKKQRMDGDWWHIHCAGGKGRSTSFMFMLDAMYNANLFSVEEIMERQEALKGENLRKLKDSNKSDQKKRFEVLSLFHQYCQENMPNFETSWVDWKIKFENVDHTYIHAQ